MCGHWRGFLLGTLEERTVQFLRVPLSFRRNRMKTKHAKRHGFMSAFEPSGAKAKVHRERLFKLTSKAGPSFCLMT
jgi:hypothetical protein